MFFALAAVFGHASYWYGNVSSGAFVLKLGGWLGSAILFVHGIRVLSLKR